jgi:capsular exopolysaccharide synthesis family protein
MSRIDEALKRAAAGADRFAPVREAPAPAPEQPILDRYPGEAPPAPPRDAGEPRLHARMPPDVNERFAAAVVAAEAPPHVLAPAGDPPRPGAQKLIVNGQKGSMAADQYRRIAAALHELQMERGLRTVMVTSALPQEGKTLTAINLALALSESYGRRVLLIDADLRRPMVHKVLGLSNGRGLSEVLASPRGTALPLLHVTQRLTALPSGRPAQNPLTGLTSARMRELLGDTATMFDWVLIDTPPVVLLPDAPLLAGLIQAAIFVIRAGVTPFPAVERAVNEIGRDRIVGTVLNQVEEQTVRATSYYGHYE